MQRVVCRNRNSKMNSRTSESTKNVAVKEEPADRGYGEPITVTNIPTSTAQDTRNGKESLIYQMNEINSGETKKERTRWIMLLQRALRGSYWHDRDSRTDDTLFSNVHRDKSLDNRSTWRFATP